MIKECPNRFLHIFNPETGEYYYLDCKSWKCPHCGPRKAARLSKYFASQTSKFEVVRLLTITFRSVKGLDTEEHYKLLQEIWRRCITELRRDPRFGVAKEIKYLRVNELHQSGFTHLHLLVNKFIKQQYLYEKINHIAKVVLQKSELKKIKERGFGDTIQNYKDVEILDKQLCSVNIKFVQDNRTFASSGFRRQKGIERYLIKNFYSPYLVKKMHDTASETETKERPFKKFWSRSRGFENINHKKNTGAIWFIFNDRTGKTTLNLYTIGYLRNFFENYFYFFLWEFLGTTQVPLALQTIIGSARKSAAESLIS